MRWELEMVTQPAWMTTRTGRPAMRHPGRPPTRRDVERAFWDKIAAGLTSEDAAVAVGASGTVGSRSFRERGGMSPFPLLNRPGSGGGAGVSRLLRRLDFWILVPDTRSFRWDDRPIRPSSGERFLIFLQRAAAWP